jgi:hypothetical protein
VQREREGFMRKRKNLVILIALVSVFTLSACSKKEGVELIKTSEPFGFISVKPGDSKEDVKVVCGDDPSKEEVGLIGYDNLKTVFESKSQQVVFTLNTSNEVNVMSAAWTTESEEGAQRIYDNLKKKAESTYGDSYDDKHEDEVSERCVWETEGYRFWITLDLNNPQIGNLVNMLYIDYTL